MDEIIAIKSKELLARIAEGDEQSRQLVPKAIDEHTVRVVLELDGLIHELEGLKQHIVSKAADCKQLLDEHLQLAGEAAGFAEAVRRRLSE
jgi:hypothetical protein